MATTVRDLSWHLAHAAEQLDRRLRNGDQISVPRELDHFAVFSTKRRAKAAARELEQLGYETSISRFRFSQVLTASHVSPVDEETSTAFLTELVGVVERHGGRFDGWRARIVPAH